MAGSKANSKDKKEKKSKVKKTESKKTTYGVARVLEEAEVWGDFAHHQQSVFAARAAVKTILDSTQQQAELNELNRKIQGKFPDDVVECVVQSLEWALRLPDMKGDDTGCMADVDGDGTWELEPEPARCRIDRWARGVIPVKKSLAVGKEDELASYDIQIHKKPRSRFDALSMASRGSRISSSNKARSSSINPTSGAAVSETAGKPRPFAISLPPEQVAEQQRLEAIRQRGLRKVAQQQILKQKWMGTESEASSVAGDEAVDTASESQLTSQGSLQAALENPSPSSSPKVSGKTAKVSTQPKSDNLPIYKATPRFAVRSSGNIPIEKPNSRRRPHAPPRKHDSRAHLDSGRKRKLKPAGVEHVGDLAAAPSLLDTIQVVPGVTVRDQNGRTKSAENSQSKRDRTTDIRNMTRSEYNRMIEGANGLGGTALDGKQSTTFDSKLTSNTDASVESSKHPTPRTGQATGSLKLPPVSTATGITIGITTPGRHTHQLVSNVGNAPQRKSNSRRGRGTKR